ncbi:hypothetical protein [Larkinella terrae]|uniref:Uncharacterized protein n=1 Tax=Larkinella terrae TaxID=2025311 RepID=A0A7K0EH31_9BACT|nr:hypothetical protein [Larkinella terrae]MRS60881.1 hypothetical protein [Larkinella terrae]
MKRFSGHPGNQRFFRSGNYPVFPPAYLPNAAQYRFRLDGRFLRLYFCLK